VFYQILEQGSMFDKINIQLTEEEITSLQAPNSQSYETAFVKSQLVFLVFFKVDFFKLTIFF